MKIIYKLLFLSILPVVILIMGYSTGSPGGRSGSLGDGGTNCTQCHYTGTTQNATNWVSTNIPVTGYVPGQTYTITVSGTHTGVAKFGFELTAENSAGAKVGTFAITNATQTQLTNGGKAVTHKAAGTTPTGSTKTWTASWTAPATSVGAVTFSAALNAANGNMSPTDDVIYVTSRTVQPATLVNVTFRVDMSDQVISPLGVHIAGSFQSPPWQPGATLVNPPMLGKVYTVTIAIPAGTYIEYKFINGNAWGSDESVPPSCAVGGNRFYTVPSTAVVLPIVCFGSCNACTANRDVTFRVDMSEQVVGPNGVFLAGTMNNWNATSQPMVHAGNNIYTITKSLPAGETTQYKFVNSGTWEQVPAGCAISGNRFYLVPSENSILDPICFGSCVICAPPTVNVTFNLDMTYETISENGVHIAGTFNGWNTEDTPMIPAGNNIYSITMPLAIGNSYEFKYINGNTAAGYESVPPECALNNNRYLTVGDVDTNLDTVCFASCSPCGPPPVPVEMTIQVDMTDVTIVPEGVHVAGTFQGWDPGATLMTQGADNIYFHTFTVNSGTYHEYKFINGNTFGQAEIVPGECSNNGNRFFTTPDVNTTLDLVCYQSCEACPPPGQVDVTFKVDMSLEAISPNGIHLVGSFQDWNYTATPMASEGNGIYSVTIPLLEGEYHTYKFVNGAASNLAEIVPAECGAGSQLTGYTRYLTVPVENTTLETVCFGGCGPCIPPLMANVTFKVDMTGQFVSANGIHIAGSFQGWNPASTAMTDMGNGIYSVTLPLVVAQHHIYKFINGNSFDDQESVPADCGEADGYGGYNRFIDVPANDIVLNTVCFGKCTACPPLVNVTFQVDMTNEVVSPDGVHIAGDFQGWNTATSLMTLATGNIYTFTASLLSDTYYEFKYINGNTWDFDEFVPGACNQNGNRFVTVPTVETVLDPVCFSGCGVCPMVVPVTFNVDMTTQTVAAEGVYLVGDFNGWDTVATPMTTQGNGIYSVTRNLEVGSYQTYRFVNGNSFAGAETVPAECGVDDGFGGFKRFINVPDVATVLDVICFASCLPCPLNHTIALSAGWNSLSSYLMPDETDIVALLEQVYPELVILQTMTEVYYPEGEINTIVNWESQSSYKIKLTQSVNLTITGQPEPNKTVQLEAGWNMIPVITSENVDVAALFSSLGSNLAVVMGIANSGIYWPVYNINTIGTLQPGKAYFVKVTEPASITFP